MSRMKLFIILLVTLLCSAEFIHAYRHHHYAALSSPIPRLYFSCIGESPDWNMQITDKMLTFFSPQVASLPIVSVTQTRVSRKSKNLITIFKTVSTPNTPSIVVMIQKTNHCKTSEQSKVYEYSAVVLLPNRTLTGCSEQYNGFGSSHHNSHFTPLNFG
ncbi:MAG: hypothetical protein ACE365_06295 [Gammaproteobacteria bacterium]